MELICKHDINVFINRQLIYNYPEQLFADKGVMAIEHADFDGIERLALVTGGEIVSTFGKPELVKVKEIITFLLSFWTVQSFSISPIARLFDDPNNVQIPNPQFPTNFIASA